MSLFATGDVTAFRSDYLAEPAKKHFPDATFSDTYLLAKLQAAEQETSMALKVLLEPTKIFSVVDPTSDQITALGETPYLVEPGYDYGPDFYDGSSWGYIVTRQQPIISVDFIQFAYPSPEVAAFQIPTSWMRIDKKYGTIRLVPATASWSAPLGAFLMQAMGGGSVIPSMIEIQYMAGLQNAKTAWPALMDVIYKTAVLKIIQDTWATASGSISVDGMSQSLSIDMKGWREIIDVALNGPKGSNGGLWTAIHGLTNTVMGVVV